MKIKIRFRFHPVYSKFFNQFNALNQALTPINAKQLACQKTSDRKAQPEPASANRASIEKQCLDTNFIQKNSKQFHLIERLLKRKEDLNKLKISA